MNIPSRIIFRLAKTIFSNLTIQRTLEKRFRARVPPDRIKKILVLSHTYIGDAVMQTPLISLIRKSFPAAVISVLTNPTTHHIYKYNTDINESIPCLPKSWFRAFNLTTVLRLLRLRLKRYDLCILDSEACFNGGKVIARLAGPRYLIADQSIASDDNYLCNELVETDQTIHRVERSLQVILKSALSHRFCITATQIRLSPILVSGCVESSEADEILRVKGIDRNRPIVGLVVGSNDGSDAVTKRWPEASFKGLIDGINDTRPDAQIAVFKGPQESDIDYTDYVNQGCFVIDQVPLLVAAAVIEKCDALIGNDSGLGHIAASLSVPTIIIFGPTDSRLIRPYASRVVSVRVEGCPPCFEGQLMGRCNGERGCITGVSSQSVLRELRLLVPRFQRQVDQQVARNSEG